MPRTKPSVVIRPLLAGARAATGTVVIIDVFTATTLVTTLLDVGAREVVPVGHRRQALDLAAQDSTTILIGESWGKKIRGFAHNTSAVRASELDVTGGRVVLCTTNGTRGILGAQKAEQLVLGCFRNADALVQSLAGEREVSLVPIGLANGRMSAIEDQLCAEYLKRRLEGESVEASDSFLRIRRDLSQRVRNLGRSEDVAFCLETGASEVVPELVGGRLVGRF